MRRVNVDRMRRYRERTRTATPAALLANVTAWRYAPMVEHPEPDLDDEQREVEERLRQRYGVIESGPVEYGPDEPWPPFALYFPGPPLTAEAIGRILPAPTEL